MPVPATPARTAGANDRRASGTSGHGVVGLPDQAVVEAGAGAGVARRPLLVDLQQHGVAVAVEADATYPLSVARGLALGPVLPPAPAPVRRAARGQRAGQRLVVH